jgi:hypothetical protein
MGLQTDLTGVISAGINMGRRLPKTDLSALFKTIDDAGSNKAALINGLPESLKPLYDQYKESLGAAGTNLQDTTKQIGQDLLTQTKANYDPNSAAVQATLAALKQQDYSTLPGTMTNLKAQLASTGGLGNGGAGRAITSAVMAPAAQFSQQAANTEAQQLQLQQTNVQSALNKIASMDDATAQQLFGMSTQEAQTILTSGRQDLQNQLSSLINNIDTTTNAKLGLQGYEANQAYQQGMAKAGDQAAITNGLVNAVPDAIKAYYTGGLSEMMPSGDSGSSGMPAGTDVGSASYYQNALANKPSGI